MTRTSAVLHCVDATEAQLAERRAAALKLFSLHHADPSTRATMLSALRRLARTFSAGQCTDESQFPWELLIDAADVLAIRAAMLDNFQRATVMRDLVALKQILHCCWRVGLLSYDQLQVLTDLPRLPPPGSARTGYYLTPDDLGALLAACRRDANAAKGLRDAAIIAAASTGSAGMSSSASRPLPST